MVGEDFAELFEGVDRDLLVCFGLEILGRNVRIPQSRDAAITSRKSGNYEASLTFELITGASPTAFDCSVTVPLDTGATNSAVIDM